MISPIYQRVFRLYTKMHTYAEILTLLRITRTGSELVLWDGRSFYKFSARC